MFVPRQLDQPMIHAVNVRPSRSPFYHLGALAALVLLAACDDGPTAPKVFTHPADGEVWAAVLVPEGAPDARTWLPYVRDGRSAASPVAREVRQLQAEAQRLRRAGDIAGAYAREEEAAMAAARSISQNPPAHVLITALASLDTWSERARSAVEQGEFEELAERLERVMQLAERARLALAAGDTATAIQEVTAGAALIREQAPAVVAARVLARAEQRLIGLAETDADAARAVRLLRYSREALANGDPVRALRRALYALQLAEQVRQQPTAPLGTFSPVD